MYEIIKEIGAGAFGRVFKAKNTRTGDLVAIKRIVPRQTEDLSDEGLPYEIQWEIDVLRNMDHHNITRLIDVYDDPHGVHIVMELMDESLYDRNSWRGAEPIPVRSCMRQIIQGLIYLHAKLLVHRDLQPRNILINADNTVKLADLGISDGIESDGTTGYSGQGARWYCAPELLLAAARVSPAVDIWSLGCIFLELITRHPAFPGDSTIDQIYRIFQNLGTPPHSKMPYIDASTFGKYPKWPGRESLLDYRHRTAEKAIRAMLDYTPAARPSAAAILDFSYFGISC